MMNDEIQMPKQAGRRRLRNLNIRASFVIRHSSFVINVDLTSARVLAASALLALNYHR
jgi:hypothetical protein